MLFALNKRLLDRLCPGRRFLFFLLLWLLSGLFLFCHLQFLKSQIQNQELQRLQSGLDRYLKKSGDTVMLQGEPPRDVDFIRLVRGREQLLLTGNATMNFTGLVDLDPYAHGIWIDLLHPAESGSWLLVSRKLSGEVVQAGKDSSSSGLAIYRRSVSVSLWMFVLAVFPSLILSFLLFSFMQRSLRQLQSDMARALEKRSLPLPKAFEKDEDLAILYRQLDQLFQQNRQLIQEMQASLDNVAHDLRTPMSRLRSVAEYALQSEKNDPELYRNALSDCLEESERVLSMLKVMMSVAEAESGTMRLELEELDLMEMLENVVNLYQYVAEEKHMTLSCEGKEGILVLADKTRISQVWANLLDNAIKYGHESGSVRIRVEKRGERAVVRFYDDGMGISDTEISRIWDRLYRGDRSRSRQGLGLGLNYVKAVVEAHKGRVMVTSKIREGSCFTVNLPLLPQ